MKVQAYNIQDRHGRRGRFRVTFFPGSGVPEGIIFWLVAIPVYPNLYLFDEWLSHDINVTHGFVWLNIRFLPPNRYI